jgi:hypothetical protein
MGGDLWARTQQQFILPRPTEEQPRPQAVDRPAAVDLAPG